MTRVYDSAPTRTTIDGEEQQCKTCLEWWPLDKEFFYARTYGRGFECTCRSCYRGRDKRYSNQVSQPVPDVFSAVQWGYYEQTWRKE